LEVLDEREFEHIAIARRTKDDRNVRKSKFTAGTPTPLARDQLVASLNLPDDERLDHAVFAY
jgi:hypothetical protein